MPSIVELAQQSPEWHKFREGKIGSSDAPRIMGVSLHGTAYELWTEKVGLCQRKENDYLKKFVKDEDRIRAYYLEMTGIETKPMVMQSPLNERLIASFDGVNLEKNIAIEIKNADEEDHAICMAGEVPEQYYPQVQHQLYVSGYQKMDYISSHKKSIVILTVERDDKYIEKLLEKEISFLQNIDDFIAPEMTARDYFNNDSEDFKQELEQWVDVTNQIKLLTSRQERLKKSLITMCQGRNTRGFGIKIQRIVRKGAIDYGLVPHLNGVNLEPYRKSPIESWRIS